MLLNPRTVRSVALLAVAAMVSSASAFAQTKEEKKAQEAKQQSVRTLLRAADNLHAAQLPEGAYTIKANAKNDAQPAGDAGTVTLRHHSFKATEGKVFIPFTVSFDPKVVASNVALYVRAVPKGTAVAKDREKSPYPFEQDFTGDAVSPAAGKPAEITRRLLASPGPHDVYVVIQPAPGAEPLKGDAMVKGIAKKFEIDVPDYFNGELTTSDVLLFDKAEAFKEAPTQETFVNKPYSVTGLDAVPALDNELKPTDELLVFYQVYNPTLENKKPDVIVEYEFLRKDADGEKPAMSEDGKKLVYNAQKYNAQTLPAQWDGEAGYQIVPALAIPLNMFPAGDYKVNIKITDNKAQKSITRTVDFKVVAG